MNKVLKKKKENEEEQENCLIYRPTRNFNPANKKQTTTCFNKTLGKIAEVENESTQIFASGDYTEPPATVINVSTWTPCSNDQRTLLNRRALSVQRKNRFVGFLVTIPLQEPPN